MNDAQKNQDKLLEEKSLLDLNTRSIIAQFFIEEGIHSDLKEGKESSIYSYIPLAASFYSKEERAGEKNEFKDNMQLVREHRLVQDLYQDSKRDHLIQGWSKGENCSERLQSIARIALSAKQEGYLDADPYQLFRLMNGAEHASADLDLKAIELTLLRHSHQLSLFDLLLFLDGADNLNLNTLLQACLSRCVESNFIDGLDEFGIQDFLESIPKYRKHAPEKVDKAVESGFNKLVEVAGDYQDATYLLSALNLLKASEDKSHFDGFLQRVDFQMCNELSTREQRDALAEVLRDMK